MDYFPNHSHAGLYLFRILHSTQDTVHEQQACHMIVLFASAQGLATCTQFWLCFLILKNGAGLYIHICADIVYIEDTLLSAHVMLST